MLRTWRVLRLSSLTVLLTLLMGAAACGGDVAGIGAATVVVLPAKGPVTPVMAGYLNRGITMAERGHAAAVVILIDTPGGLDSSMRDIVQRINAATVPVIAYVGPDGARAASAGAFIVMAAPVAAMAPTTAIGAAHPVGSEGQDIAGTMGEKVTNDAAAYMRSIAQRRGRNAEWAERAVRESVSLAADEAAGANVVDLVAADLPALLQAVDGRTVRLPAGDVRLATRDARLQQEELTPAERLLAAIADPNIAFLLMSLAMLAIFIELSHPGSILPGIVGGICLLLALFALGTLPVNLTGLLLIGLGFVLLLAEVWVTSSGLLAIGGLTALGLGAMLLVSESAPPSFEVNRWLIAGTLAVMAVPFLLLARSLASLRRREHRTGLEALVGLRGVARTALAPVGTVLVHGELWQATAEDESLEPETAVVVTGVEGFALRVKRAESLKMGV